MKKAQKQKSISFLKNVFANSKCLVLTSIEGMSAAELDLLRKIVRKNNVNFKVCKNKLLKLSTKNTDLDLLTKDFVGSTALTWCSADILNPIKTVFEIKKLNETFIIKSGYASGSKLTFADIEDLSGLNNYNELNINLLKNIQNAIYNFVSHIKRPVLYSLSFVKNLEKIKEK